MSTTATTIRSTTTTTVTKTTISSTNTTKLDCVSVNAHVNSLRGTTTKNVPGWNLDNVDQGSVKNDTWKHCGNSYDWYGYLSGRRRGSINTTLRGCGVAKLDFGECAGNLAREFTQVNLNGKEIGRATGLQLSKTIEFNFKDGDILELKEGNGYGVIRFNSFTVISYC